LFKATVAVRYFSIR